VSSGRPTGTLSLLGEAQGAGICFASMVLA
jgi:hypothetical protein